MTVVTVICILLLLFLNIRRDVVISNAIHRNLQHRNRFDAEKILTGSNYAVCGNLKALEEDLIIEEFHRDKYLKVYEELTLKGELGCGFEKRYDGMLGFMKIGTP